MVEPCAGVEWTLWGQIPRQAALPQKSDPRGVPGKNLCRSRGGRRIDRRERPGERMPGMKDPPEPDCVEPGWNPPPQRGFAFDERDVELVSLVNEFRRSGRRKNPHRVRSLFNPNLHPRGIKELSAAPARRIAYAMIRLLDSLDSGDTQDRLLSLRALHDELFFGARGWLPLNTARVLLSILKDLVREEGDPRRQLELAHDFFTATSGRPRFIRRMLRRYFLVEMPEGWSQVAFDHHVHDANTKGRKAPTHLIMDAWIKGIRELTVVYYNYFTIEALEELIEAADIMGIRVRPTVEFAAGFRGKYAQFLWSPEGLRTPRDYQAFLQEGPVAQFFAQGREVSRYQQRYVMDLLSCVNRKQIPEFNQRFGLGLEPLSEKDFLDFVGVGQPSVTHLADFLHQRIVERAREALPELRRRHREASGDERRGLEILVRKLDDLGSEDLVDMCLRHELHPELPDPKLPRNDPHLPELLRLTPTQLLERLHSLRAGSRVTLNLSNLSPADVLEILYLARGAVTHLELFNLKDYRLKKNRHLSQIDRIRIVLNRRSPIQLKRLIRDTLAEIERSDLPDREDRAAVLHRALAEVAGFAEFYARTPLEALIGSDSIGRAHPLFGMGLAVEDTVPARARRAFHRHRGTREVLPLRMDTVPVTRWERRESPLPALNAAYSLLRRIPGLRRLGYSRQDGIEIRPDSVRLSPPGNVITLGGIEERHSNRLCLEDPPSLATRPGFRYWPMAPRNLAKVVIGFLPAFLAFFLTQEWWLLAWFGAPIWFAITGLRNVLQAVVGGGGLRRSKLIGWRDLVNWERVADSLLFTGFSVPLLDWLMKGQILDRGLGVNTHSAPLLMYTAMALTNGIYLYTHNTFRGLPRAAAVANLFRSVFAIPLAFGLNLGLHWLLVAAGMPHAEADLWLQKWAAVIVKAASDLVAGFIEGTADRNLNMRTRLRDYRAKLAQLIQGHGRLEALYPDQDVLSLLDNPKAFIQTVGREAGDLAKNQVIHLLDLMYFWMLQPRARPVLERLLREMSPEERRIVLHSQRLLERRRAVSEMILSDLVGKNFAAPLAFYLDRCEAYLRDMRRLAQRLGDPLPAPVERTAV